MLKFLNKPFPKSMSSSVFLLITQNNAWMTGLKLAPGCYSYFSMSHLITETEFWWSWTRTTWGIKFNIPLQVISEIILLIWRGSSRACISFEGAYCIPSMPKAVLAALPRGSLVSDLLQILFSLFKTFLVWGLIPQILAFLKK